MELQLTELAGPITRAQLTGRLDTAGADQVGLQLTAGVVARARPAIIDLSGVSFVSSMGIRLMISCAKALKGKGSTMVLFGAQPAVEEVFVDSGLTEILVIEPDEASALARIRG